MSKHGIFATLLHYRANTVLLKNLQRWRAADSRPYTVCAAELPPQKFRCTNAHFCGAVLMHEVLSGNV